MIGFARNNGRRRSSFGPRRPAQHFFGGIRNRPFRRLGLAHWVGVGHVPIAYSWKRSAESTGGNACHTTSKRWRELAGFLFATTSDSRTYVWPAVPKSLSCSRGTSAPSCHECSSTLKLSERVESGLRISSFPREQLVFVGVVDRGLIFGRDKGSNENQMLFHTLA